MRELGERRPAWLDGWRSVQTAARLTALTQGASYLYFGLWALVWKRHYIRTHELSGQDPWVLRAHALWMILIGSTLARAGIGKRVDDTARALAVGSATAFALNDAYSIARVAPIYRLDLAYELGFVGVWATLTRRSQGASRPR
jgi:hypothetical protein